MNHLRRAFLWTPHACSPMPLDPWQEQRHLGQHQMTVFLIGKHLVCKNKEAGIEFGRVPNPLGVHITVTSRLGRKNQSHHNCIHFSGYLVCMAEIVGLFVPYLLIWTDQPAWPPSFLGNIPLRSSMQNKPLED